jgi:hypothetical protein
VVLDGISLQVPGSWRVPAENQQFPMPCGPNADQVRELGRLSATHGPPLLSLRWLGRPIAPRTSLDPEANRGSGAKDQQKNNDPDHR